MKNSKKYTIKCQIDLCECIYKNKCQQLLYEKQKWSDYVERLILKDYALLQNTKLKKNKKVTKKDFSSSRKPL